METIEVVFTTIDEEFNAFLKGVEAGRRDALEGLVRCKDCKKFRLSTMYENWGVCLLANDEGYGVCREVRGDGFCSWGERNDEQTDYHINNDGTYRGGEDEKDSNSI